MGTLKAAADQVTKDGLIVFFQGAPPHIVADEVHRFFVHQGYRLEKGDPACGVYGKGSAVLRVLFGAFAKRFKFDVDVRPAESYTELWITKGMSGAGGGIIGYSKMKKELDRIREALRRFFL